MFLHPKKHSKHFLISEGMSVVDMGSGSGHFTLEVAERVGPHGKVYAIEIQPELVNKVAADARGAGHTHVRVIHADLEKKPNGTTLKDKIADRVLLINTLSQINDKIGVLEEAKRLLAHKGALVVIDWRPASGSPWPDHHLLHPDQAKALLKKAGFEEVLEIELPHHHYGFIARKIVKKSNK